MKNIESTFLATLKFKLKDREEVKASLIESVSKDPLYALGWSENRAIQLALGDWYAEVDRRIREDKNSVEKALRKCVDIAVRQLIGNELRGGSSSHFSNAVEAAKREAASRFVRDNERVLERLSERSEA